MFGARALVPLNDEETFHDQIWSALLIGSGVVPQGYDPRIDAVPAEQHIMKVQQRLRDVAERARRMPSVEQFLGIEQPTPELVAR
jgi:hypothetical protein